MSLTLSVLDQSPISEGKTAEEALSETVALIQHVERLGYNRFWVSEHHDSTSLAGSSPEVLAAYLAAKTETIRVGSGGVMLPHYSPYKVAENFRVLEGLNPGRIDLGIGRAPGGMPRATMALHDGRSRNLNRFPAQIDELLDYLYDTLEEDHPFFGLKAAPMTKTIPALWLLGSSPSSAQLAAEKGLPYTFAQFINGEGGPQIAQYYRQHFQPSNHLSTPKNMVAVFVVCAETEVEAERIASSLDLLLLMMEQGMKIVGTPSPEKAAAYDYSPFERARVLENRKRMIVGTPEQVKTSLYQLSVAYGADEVMIVSIMYDFQDKLKSFSFIADALF